MPQAGRPGSAGRAVALRAEPLRVSALRASIPGAKACSAPAKAGEGRHVPMGRAGLPGPWFAPPLAGYCLWEPGRLPAPFGAGNGRAMLGFASTWHARCNPSCPAGTGLEARRMTRLP